MGVEDDALPPCEDCDERARKLIGEASVDDLIAELMDRSETLALLLCPEGSCEYGVYFYGSNLACLGAATRLLEAAKAKTCCPVEEE